jgi:hypothetical protein
MKLKDKLEVEIMHLPLTDDVINGIGIELEQRAETFAIGFAEWLIENKVLSSKMPTKELLEIYKETL